MSSILRINSITSRSGINTLDFTGNGFSYVTDVGFGTTSPRGKLDVQGTFLANGGNAGIGTTLPTSRLDVVGDVQVSGVVTATSFRGDGSNLTGVAATSNIRTNAIVNSGVTTVSAGTTAIPSISPSGDPNTGIFFPEADTVAIGEGGTEVLRINSSGNVGVGTNNPSQKLDVFVNRTSSTNATSIVLNDNVTGNQTDGVYKAIRSISNNGSSVSEIRFVETDGTNNNTAIVLATQSTAGALTERFRVHRDGNVGIGISNPAARLVVIGSGNLIRLGDGTNTFDVRFQGPNNWATQLDTTNDIFNVLRNSVPLVTVRGDGNLGIGTTNPTEKLHVVGDGIFGSGSAGRSQSFADGIHIQPTSTNATVVTGLCIGNDGSGSGTGGAIALGAGNATASTAAFVEGFFDGTGTAFTVKTSSSYGVSAATERLKIDSSGNVTPGANATQNLGSSSLRWANIFSADLQLSNEGSQNDIDGTWGNYTIQEGENDLFLINRRNGKKYKFVLQEVN